MRRFIVIIFSSLLVLSFLTSCSSNSNLTSNQGFVPSCAGIDLSGTSTNELFLDCLDSSGAINFYSIQGPIVVNVWGSWCEGCRKEMPYFVQLYQSQPFKSGEIKLLGQRRKTMRRITVEVDEEWFDILSVISRHLDDIVTG